MKQCPQCRQAYDDDTNFCLNDGTTLVMMINTYDSQAETPTVVGGFAAPTAPPFQISSPPQSVAASGGSGRTWLAIVAVILFLLLGGGAVVGGLYWYATRTTDKPLANANATPATPKPSATATPDDNGLAENLKKEQDRLAKERKKLEDERKKLEQEKKEFAENQEFYDDNDIVQATVVDPPTNIRSKPNGTVICVVDKKIKISILGELEADDGSGLWYVTDTCGRQGVVHSSQLAF